MGNDVSSIQFRESLVKAIKRVMLDEGFPFDNVSVFVAIAFKLLKEDWDNAKSTNKQKDFKNLMFKVIDELKRKDLIHPDSRGVKK